MRQASTMRRLYAALAALAAVAVLGPAPTAEADILWNITFNDVENNTGVGFDDPTLGATRRSTVMAVTNFINTVILDNGVIDLVIGNSQTDGGGFLGAAGPFFFTGPDGFRNGFAFEHATTGVDPLPGAPDASAVFDFGFNFNSDTDAPTSSEIDLFSVVLHEFTHALGFVSLLNADGTGLNGDNPDVFSVFDSFLELGDGTPLFGAGGEFLGDPDDLTSDDVFFDGPNARKANGGNPVKIFAPDAFAGGSSLSHTSPSAFPNTLMNPAIGPGQQRRMFSEVEIGILADLGYTVIPEPSSVLLVGLGLTGALVLARRRRIRQAA